MKEKFIYWFKGIILGLMITLISLILITFLLRFTSLRESKLLMLNNLVMVISIVIGSIYVAIKTEEKGWINGALMGVGYYFVLVLLNIAFIKPFQMDIFTIWKLLSATVTGAIGGMIGINIS